MLLLATHPLSLLATHPLSLALTLPLSLSFLGILRCRRARCSRRTKSRMTACQKHRCPHQMRFPKGLGALQVPVPYSVLLVPCSIAITPVLQGTLFYSTHFKVACHGVLQVHLRQQPLCQTPAGLRHGLGAVLEVEVEACRKPLAM